MTTMLPPESLLNNRYRVVVHVGQGGMGSVYEAVDERLRSRVALKQTTVASVGPSRAFEREAQILAGLRHPALPRVIDHFVVPEGQFLVMEFIPGEDLAASLRELAAPFPVDQIVSWAEQLLDVLDYLHTQTPPVVHRDIKPQNLKLTAGGEIVLLDFGLAKGSAALPTRAPSEEASLFGYTPQYAPLEQVQGSGTDARADIYSLAATLYHLGTGQIPPDALSRATAVLNGRPDPLLPAHQLAPAMPSALSAILGQAMALNAAERFNTARAMRRAIELIGEPITDLPAATGPTVIARPPAPSAARPERLPALDAPRAPALPTAARPGPERRGLPLPAILIGLVALLLLLCVGSFFALRGLRVSSSVDIQPGQPTGAPAAATPDVREDGVQLPPATPVALGTELVRLQGQIAAPGAQNAYSFTADAGRELFVWTASFDKGMDQIRLRLLDARGDEVANGCLGCGNMGVQPMRAGGSYTLLVGSDSDPATGAYELRLNLVPPTLSFEVGLDTRIAEDSPGAGAALIAMPGARNEFRFEAPPGQRLFVWAAGHDDGMDQIRLRLLDANGDEVATSCLGCGNMGAQPLRAGGRYSLVVGSEIDPATGAFDLRLSAVPPTEQRDVTLPLRVTDGLIAKPGAEQAFRFTAQSGQAIFVTTTSYDTGMDQIWLRLLDANGDEVATSCLGCGNMGAQSLQAGSAYSVVVGSEIDPATGAYAFEVTLVP